MKGNKGITLIALVITIIVLLILAGVSIAMLANNNSILGRAQSTVYMNEIGEGKDFVALAWNAAYTEYLNQYYTNSTSATALGELFSTELGKKASDAKFDVSYSAENKKVTVTSKSNSSKSTEATVTITSPTGQPTTGNIGAWSAVSTD